MASLTPLPASFVSHDLRQRHGDLVWRVRFKDDRWLYVVLLLEFQSAVDRSMAVRMLTYTGLLYQKLIADGVLRGRGGLPPVPPVVIDNGRRPCRADRLGRRGGVGAVSAVGTSCWTRAALAVPICRRAIWCRR